jgi:hypothetical protein
MADPYLPIIYVRGFVARDASGTVDDPFYGFNSGSTHVRQDGAGEPQFFAFEGPLIRLMSDHGYRDAYEAGVQARRRERNAAVDGSPAGAALTAADTFWSIVTSPLRRTPKALQTEAAVEAPAPPRSIWIFRYYDQTARSFPRTSRDRQELEESADGLRRLIAHVIEVTGAPRVVLVGHSTGGLIIRSLLQRTYPAAGQDCRRFVDKVFTYATPHGGIHFSGGPLGWLGGTLGDLIERARDGIGDLFEDSNIDDFGQRRLRANLATDEEQARPQWSPGDPPSTFPVERFFCLVGTNYSDYDLPRYAIGPRSDGLVQIESAYLRGAPRAYVHRSHSGRYGVVNSEEGYQNLERFLFGDQQVQLELSGLSALDAQRYRDLEDGTVFSVDATVSIRGLPAFMHDQQLQHQTAVPVERRKLESGEPVPLFRAFIDSRQAPQVSGERSGDGQRTVRYAVHLSVHEVDLRRGRQVLPRHVEQVARWSDVLVCDLEANDVLRTMWVSQRPDWQDADAAGTPVTGKIDGRARMFVVPLPKQARHVLGEQAVLRILAFPWNYWHDGDHLAAPIERTMLTRLEPEALGRLSSDGG